MPFVFPEMTAAFAYRLLHPDIIARSYTRNYSFACLYSSFNAPVFAYFFATIPSFFRYNRFKITLHIQMSAFITIDNRFLVKVVISIRFKITLIPHIGRVM